jgi:hypothetical protein
MAITDFDSAFWSDPWLRRRSTHARYLFSYLFTSAHKNRSGAYPIGLDIIVFETGMTEEKVGRALKELEPKVLYDYDNEIVFVTNHVRHQYAKKKRIAPTISSSIVTDLNKLPKNHDFIDIFIEKYSDFFGLEGSVVIEYEYTVGKGREGEEVKYNEDFKKFWKAYPARTGKKRGKPAAFKNFLKFKPEEWPILIECAKNYAKSQKARSNFAKDPERFLKNNYWQDWKEPEVEAETIQESDEQRVIWKKELRDAEEWIARYKESQSYTEEGSQEFARYEADIKRREKEAVELRKKLGIQEDDNV